MNQIDIVSLRWILWSPAGLSYKTKILNSYPTYILALAQASQDIGVVRYDNETNITMIILGEHVTRRIKT